MKLTLALILFTTSALAQPVLVDRQTGKYLGDMSANEYAPNSTSNEYGRYGSQYSTESINNPYSQHGSPYSNDSASNPYATNPPEIVIPNPQKY
jgi:hypothetical protein